MPFNMSKKMKLADNSVPKQLVEYPRTFAESINNYQLPNNNPLTQQFNEAIHATPNNSNVMPLNINGPKCSVPSCDNHDTNIYGFSTGLLKLPSIEVIENWSNLLGVSLTADSLLCERHFKPEYIYNLKSTDGKKEIKSILNGAIPKMIEPKHMISMQQMANINKWMLGLNDQSTTTNAIDLSNRDANVLKPFETMPLNLYNETPHYNSEFNMGQILPKLLSNSALSVTVLQNQNNVETSSSASSVHKAMVSIQDQINRESVTISAIPRSLSSDAIGFHDFTHTIYKKPYFIFNAMVSDFDKPNALLRDKIHYMIEHDLYYKKDSNTQVPIVNSNNILFKNFYSMLKSCHNIIVPSFFWKCVHNTNLNKLLFIQVVKQSSPIKEVLFDGSLKPNIVINGRNYQCNILVKSKDDLENLLEKVDDIAICWGIDEYIPFGCLRYYEKISNNTVVCARCQEIKNFGLKYDTNARVTPTTKSNLKK